MGWLVPDLDWNGGLPRDQCCPRGLCWTPKEERLLDRPMGQLRREEGNQYLFLRKRGPCLEWVTGLYNILIASAVQMPILLPVLKRK